MWQTMETFSYPTEEWEFDHQSWLFYDPKIGIRIGYCILRDEDENDYAFYYDRDGLSIKPTHWMPLPDRPEIP